MKFFIIISTIFIFLVSPFAVLAENNVSTSSANINYLLAWPGILPDNKLYKLKVLRDKIIRVFIKDPVKKIEYDLLLADKTINAANILNEKGNNKLAKETLYKGENNFTNLVDDYRRAYWFHYKIPKRLDDKIKQASLKHQEIISKMIVKASGDDKKSFEEVLEFSKRNSQELINLKLKKNP